MATTPVPMRLGPDVQGHANAVPGVVRDATHRGKLPALVQVACTHPSIGLKPATGQDDGFAVQVRKAIWPLYGHPNNTALLVLQQSHTFCGVANLHPEPIRYGKLLV